MLKHKKQILQGLAHAAGVALYASGISALMANGQKIFGPMQGIWGGAIILTLICASVAILGSLIFARPIYLVMTGEKKEGIMHLLFTLGWLIVLLIIAFSYVAIFSENNVPVYY